MTDLWKLLQSNGRDLLAIEEAIGGIGFLFANAAALEQIEAAYHLGGLPAVLSRCGDQLESIFNQAGGWPKLKPVLPNIANIVKALNNGK